MRARRISALLALGLLSACTAMSDVDYRAVSRLGGGAGAADGTSHYDHAKVMLREGLYGLAIHSLRQDLIENGPTERNLNALGVAFDAIGRPKVARRYFDQALRHNPDSMITRVNLAQFHIRYSEPREALMHVREARDESAGGGEDRQTLRSVAVAQELAAQHQLVTMRASRSSVPADAQRPVIERVGPRTSVLSVSEKAAGRFGADSRREKKVTQSVPSAPTETPSSPVWSSFREVVIEGVPPVEGSLAYLAPASWGVPSTPLTLGETRRAPAKAAVRPDGVYRVTNGTGRSYMARRFSHFLGDQGFAVKQLANADHYNYASTVIRYTAGHRKEAEALAHLLPTVVVLEQAETLRAPVEVILGADLLDFDETLQTA